MVSARLKTAIAQSARQAENCGCAAVVPHGLTTAESDAHGQEAAQEHAGSCAQALGAACGSVPPAGFHACTSSVSACERHWYKDDWCAPSHAPTAPKTNNATTASACSGMTKGEAEPA